MIKVPPLLILFLVQFLLIFSGLTIVLFFKYRKIHQKEVITRGEVSRLRDNLNKMLIQKDKASGYKDKFNDLQKKYEYVTNIHAKLNADINKLLNEATGTNEHVQAGDIGQGYSELEAYIGALRKGKEMLHSNSKSLEDEIKNLSEKLDHSVSKEEYDILNVRKKGLESKCDKLKKDLEEKSAEHESLKKNYLWLEKEYNALYDNIASNISD